MFPNPVNSSISYFLDGVLPCFVNLIVLLLNTFSPGLTSFLALFCDGCPSVSSSSSFLSRVKAFPTGEDSEITPFFLAICFFNQICLLFLSFN